MDEKEFKRTFVCRRATKAVFWNVGAPRVQGQGLTEMGGTLNSLSPAALERIESFISANPDLKSSVVSYLPIAAALFSLFILIFMQGWLSRRLNAQRFQHLSTVYLVSALVVLAQFQACSGLGSRVTHNTQAVGPTQVQPYEIPSNSVTYEVLVGGEIDLPLPDTGNVDLYFNSVETAAYDANAATCYISAGLSELLSASDYQIIDQGGGRSLKLSPKKPGCVLVKAGSNPPLTVKIGTIATAAGAIQSGIDDAMLANAEPNLANIESQVESRFKTSLTITPRQAPVQSGLFEVQSPQTAGLALIRKYNSQSAEFQMLKTKVMLENSEIFGKPEASESNAEASGMAVAAFNLKMGNPFALELDLPGAIFPSLNAPSDQMTALGMTKIANFVGFTRSQRAVQNAIWYGTSVFGGPWSFPEFGYTNTDGTPPKFLKGISRDLLSFPLSRLPGASGSPDAQFGLVQIFNSLQPDKSHLQGLSGDSFLFVPSVQSYGFPFKALLDFYVSGLAHGAGVGMEYWQGERLQINVAKVIVTNNPPAGQPLPLMDVKYSASSTNSVSASDIYRGLMSFSSDEAGESFVRSVRCVLNAVLDDQPIDWNCAEAEGFNPNAFVDEAKWKARILALADLQKKPTTDVCALSTYYPFQLPMSEHALQVFRKQAGSNCSIGGNPYPTKNEILAFNRFDRFIFYKAEAGGGGTVYVNTNASFNWQGGNISVNPWQMLLTLAVRKLDPKLFDPNQSMARGLYSGKYVGEAFDFTDEDVETSMDYFTKMRGLWLQLLAMDPKSQAADFRIKPGIWKLDGPYASGAVNYTQNLDRALSEDSRTIGSVKMIEIDPKTTQLNPGDQTQVRLNNVQKKVEIFQGSGTKLACPMAGSWPNSYMGEGRVESLCLQSELVDEPGEANVLVLRASSNVTCQDLATQGYSFLSEPNQVIDEADFSMPWFYFFGLESSPPAVDSSSQEVPWVKYPAPSQVWNKRKAQIEDLGEVTPTVQQVLDLVGLAVTTTSGALTKPVIVKSADLYNSNQFVAPSPELPSGIGSIFGGQSKVLWSGVHGGVDSTGATDFSVQTFAITSAQADNPNIYWDDTVRDSQTHWGFASLHVDSPSFEQATQLAMGFDKGIPIAYQADSQGVWQKSLRLDPRYFVERPETGSLRFISTGSGAGFIPTFQVGVMMGWSGSPWGVTLQNPETPAPGSCLRKPLYGPKPCTLNLRIEVLKNGQIVSSGAWGPAPEHKYFTATDEKFFTSEKLAANNDGPKYFELSRPGASTVTLKYADYSASTLRLAGNVASNPNSHPETVFYCPPRFKSAWMTTSTSDVCIDYCETPPICCAQSDNDCVAESAGYGSPDQPTNCGDKLETKQCGWTSSENGQPGGTYGFVTGSTTVGVCGTNKMTGEGCPAPWPPPAECIGPFHCAVNGLAETPDEGPYEPATEFQGSCAY